MSTTASLHADFCYILLNEIKFTFLLFVIYFYIMNLIKLVGFIL